MTKEELKALGLTDEQVAKITEDYGKNYVSKAQFNQKNEEAKTLKGELDTVKGEIETLKKNNADNAALVKQIDDLKAAGKKRDEDYAAKIEQMHIDGIVEKALISSKAKNTAAVKALLDLSKAERDGETIKGLEDQIKKIKETDSYLFGSDTPTGVIPGQGGDPGQSLSTQQQFEQAIGL